MDRTEPARTETTSLRVARQLFASLRTVWLIVGVCVVMLLVLEGGVRAVNAVSKWRREQRLAALPPAMRDPQESAPWFDEFTREYDATRPQRWKSYVYFGRRPNYTGRYVNIDADGHRVTPQP